MTKDRPVEEALAKKAEVVDPRPEAWAEGRLSESEARELRQEAEQKAELSARLHRLRPSNVVEIEHLVSVAEGLLDTSSIRSEVQGRESSIFRWVKDGLCVPSWAYGLAFAAATLLVCLNITRFEPEVSIEGLSDSTQRTLESGKVLELKLHSAALEDAKLKPMIWRREGERFEPIDVIWSERHSHTRVAKILTDALAGHSYDDVELRFGLVRGNGRGEKLWGSSVDVTVRVRLPSYALADLTMSSRYRLEEDIQPSREIRTLKVPTKPSRLRLRLEPNERVRSSLNVRAYLWSSTRIVELMADTEIMDGVVVLSLDTGAFSALERPQQAQLLVMIGPEDQSFPKPVRGRLQQGAGQIGLWRTFAIELEYES